MMANLDNVYFFPKSFPQWIEIGSNVILWVHLLKNPLYTEKCALAFLFKADPSTTLLYNTLL